VIERWRTWARGLAEDLQTVYLAAGDPRTPWPAKALALVVAAYAFSPIDLIPDFIPVLGYLDDLILVPLGIMLVIRLVPPPVWNECRERAKEQVGDRRLGWIAAAAVLLVWIALALWVGRSMVPEGSRTTVMS
jgi:uncharacterized membrane protein YkvA (DUF1232 family)